MNIRRYILLASVTALSVLSLSAQETALSLDSCVALALRNNRDVRMAELQSRQYAHVKKAYWANYFPNLSASAIDVWSTAKGSVDLDMMAFVPDAVTQTVTQIGTAVATRLVQAGVFSAEEVQSMQQNLGGALSQLGGDIDYKVSNVFTAGITLEQPVYMGGKVTAAYRMGKLGHQMSLLNQQLTEDQVIVQTHEAYALLLKATELTQVALRYDSLLSQLLHDVQSAESHGLRGHNDVLKVQVKKNEAELKLVQAQNGRRLAQMNLCHCIGYALGTPVEVMPVGEERLTQAYAAQDDAIAQRPESAILDLKSQLAAQKVKLERSEFLPQLGVLAHYGYTYGGKLMGETFFDAPSFSVMASLKVPIYHAGEAQHKVKAAKLEYERTVLEQEDLMEKMNLELQQAANAFAESVIEVQMCDKSLEQATDNMRTSRKSFDVGLEPVSDLLEAQTLWQQAYASKVIAESQLIVNLAKYKKAAGAL